MDGAVVHNMLLPLGSAELFLEDLVVINTAEQRGQVNSACGGSAPPGTQSLPDIGVCKRRCAYGEGGRAATATDVIARRTHF